MKYLFSFYVLLPIMLISIKKDPGSAYTNEADKNISQPEDTAYHVDANFATKGFGYAPTTISSIKKKYAGKLKELKEAITNIHDHKITDTIVTLSGEGMKFVFYKQKQATMFTDATITSSLVVLQKGIKTGLTKNQVMKKFPEMAVAMVGADLWQIGNEERTQYFELVFKNNILKQIKYYNLID